PLPRGEGLYHAPLFLLGLAGNPIVEITLPSAPARINTIPQPHKRKHPPCGGCLLESGSSDQSIT
ncbi:hypothetical protein, partial [Xanthomonas perforans]|uniref:hypothetical protein n=1 Tax=Xanthomonas perforans TaxID=442694 RepID=UPI0019D225A0